MLPLIPGYLSFLSVAALEDVRDRRRLMAASLFFIIGFSLVFVGLGASATTGGQFLVRHVALFGGIAGVLLVALGLRAIGVFKGPSPAGAIVAVAAGAAFAFGWSPNIGPTLAVILAVASLPESAGQGIRLLSVYSLGLAMPLLFAALAVDRLVAAASAGRRHSLSIVSGVLILSTGVLVVANRFAVIARWLAPYLPAF